LIAQEPELALNPVIPIGKQIEEVLAAHRRLSRSSRKAEVESILNAVGLSAAEYYSAFAHQLSGGQRQRVVIAQALIAKPAVLIADEPTSAIDTITQSAILNLLRELQQRLGLSILYITHDPDLLRGFANRLIVMRAGQIVEQGSFSETYRNPQQAYTKELLTACFGNRCSPVATGHKYGR
jgi:ABC-type dipeptide/oligopeptide/nickel transport system ATPase component